MNDGREEKKQSEQQGTVRWDAESGLGWEIGDHACGWTQLRIWGWRARHCKKTKTDQHEKAERSGPREAEKKNGRDRTNLRARTGNRRPGDDVYWASILCCFLPLEGKETGRERETKQETKRGVRGRSRGKTETNCRLSRLRATGRTALVY